MRSDIGRCVSYRDFGYTVCPSCIIGIISDIDECELGIDDCDRNADCTNTIGDYNCTCRVGYTGDGFLCSELFLDRM